jgi:hypothetical protein
MGNARTEKKDPYLIHTNGKAAVSSARDGTQCFSARINHMLHVLGMFFGAADQLEPGSLRVLFFS